MSCIIAGTCNANPCSFQKPFELTSASKTSRKGDRCFKDPKDYEGCRVAVNCLFFHSVQASSLSFPMKKSAMVSGPT